MVTSPVQYASNIPLRAVDGELSPAEFVKPTIENEPRIKQVGLNTICLVLARQDVESRISAVTTENITPQPIEIVQTIPRA